MVRNYKIDNIRLLLIFFVVFGHLLELFPGKNRYFIYQIIYSFHIPFFLFLNGYFAKFDKKRIFKHLLVPYLIFQTGYLFFQYIFTNNNTFILQYTTPYWLLWYLLALTFYHLLLPILETNTITSMVQTFLIVFLLSLLVGFDSTIGYYMTLSRFFVFLPFFILGLYISNIKRNQVSCVLPIKHSFVNIICYLLIFLSIIYIRYSQISTSALYGSYSYIGSKTGILTRIILFIIALSWIGFFWNIIPNINIPFVTEIGKNTMSIFLLHGFIIKILSTCNIFQGTESQNIFISILIAIGILILLGNSVIGKIFKKMF